MNQGLTYILNKREIIATVSHEDLINRPDEIEGLYQQHARTHIPLGDTADIETKFLAKVQAERTPKGYVVAPYGYGKTSTIAFLWYCAEQKEFLATPPFMFESLRDVMEAVYGWARYRLRQRSPELCRRLEDLHDSYAHQELQDMAKRYARTNGITQVAALGILQALAKKGQLVRDVTPSSLLRFLDEVTQLVREADFRGLILLPDEVQQFLSRNRSQRATIEELRQFVWGLVSRNTALGVLFSMPSFAEASIRDAGSDILDRLKNDGFYFNLLGIYGKDFPAELWQRYCETLQLGNEGRMLFDKGTLGAIGQICSRTDLANGPRTVINLFRAAIVNYRDNRTSFTPEDLIDTYLRGEVRFEGQTPKIRIAVNEALNTPIVHTDQRRQAIKYLAAFPNTGCSEEVLEHYGVDSAVVEISKAGAHGTLITYQMLGYTLRSLLPADSSDDTIASRLFQDFWRLYEEDDTYAERALKAFNQELLPKLFPAKRGSSLTSWSGLNDMELAPSGCYEANIQGSFTDTYPSRIVRIRTAIDAEKLDRRLANRRSSGANMATPDIVLEFLLDWQAEPAFRSRVEAIAPNRYRLVLGMCQRLGDSLPSDIKQLQQYMHPSRVTPLLMLSLIAYMDTWIEQQENQPTVQDTALLNHFRERLLNHSIQQLFSAELHQSLPDTLPSEPALTGTRFIGQLFTLVCQKLWPDYVTFIVNARYKQVIDEYIKALQNMSPKQRRGFEPFEGTKDQISRLFGYASHATFETKVNSGLKHLIRIVDWRGRERGSVQLKLHLLEEQMLEAFRQSSETQMHDGKQVPALGAEPLLQVGIELGYRTDEIEVALKLLAARGYLRQGRNQRLILAGDSRSVEQISADAQRLRQEAHGFAQILKSPQPAVQLQQELDHLMQQLDPDVGEDERGDIDYRLQQLQPQLEELLQKYRIQARSDITDIRTQIRALLSDLSHVAFDETVVGSLGFVMHLNDLRMGLAAELKKVRTLLADAQKRCEQYTQESETLTLDMDLQEVEEQYTKLQTSISDLETRSKSIRQYFKAFQDWCSFNNRASTLFQQLTNLPDLRRKLTDEIVPQIQEVFNQKKRDALIEDYEIFDKKLKTLESEQEQIRREGQNAFAERKTQYEAALRDCLGIQQATLHGTYSFDEHESSYAALYQQVREKIEARATEVAERLQGIHADLLKAIKIVQLEDQQRLAQLTERYEGVANLPADLNSRMSLDVIGDLDRFDALCEEFKVQLTEAGDLKSGLETLARPQPVEEKEQKLLQFISPRRSVDLTEVLVRLFESEEAADIEELLRILEGLYRKNRVKIMITRLG